MYYYWRKRGLSFPSFSVFDDSGRVPLFTAHVEKKEVSEADMENFDKGEPIILEVITLKGKNEDLRITHGEALQDGGVADVIVISRQGLPYATVVQNQTLYFYREFIVNGVFAPEKDHYPQECIEYLRVIAGIIRKPKLMFKRSGRIVAEVRKNRFSRKFKWMLKIREDEDNMLILAVTLAIETFYTGVL